MSQGKLVQKKDREVDCVWIDGSSFLFRAYYALPPLTNNRGEPTGAIYGIIAMITNVIKQHNAQYCAVIFDAPGRNYRHDLYADYKKSRQRMPEELSLQIEPIYALIKAMGLPLVQEFGVEADDVIATLSRQASNNGHSSLIVTMDKDIFKINR